MLELKFLDFQQCSLEVLAIPVCQDAEIHSNAAVSKLIERAKSLTNFKAKSGEVITIFRPSNTRIQQVVFFGLGCYNKVDAERLRSFAGRAVTYGMDHNVSNMAYCMPSTGKLQVEDKYVFHSIMEGGFLSNHVFDNYKKEKIKVPINKITLIVLDEQQLNFYSLIPKVEAICGGTILARQWVNMPSNDKKPNEFAKIILNSCKDLDLTINTFDKDWLSSNKFGAMLAVGQGSVNSPCLVTMEYIHSNFIKTILLIGKGVTFDSGGINLKTSTGLEGMKTDMSGAAAVAATLIAMAKLKPRYRIIGIIPLAENMPSGAAMRPGDIVRTFSNRTVEIGNTDAEGRLTIADALGWGIEEYNPDITMDIATLTGACAVALGAKIAGVFSNNDSLSTSIVKAGEETFERCWHMPIPDDYYELLKSDLADLSNMSSSKWGGAITAAAFLSEFVGQVPWAHIDIAGPACSKNKTDYCPAGATGFGVRLFCELIEKFQM